MQRIVLVVGLVAVSVMIVALGLVYMSGVIARLATDWMRYVSPLGKFSCILLAAGMIVFLSKYLKT